MALICNEEIIHFLFFKLNHYLKEHAEIFCRVFKAFENY